MWCSIVVRNWLRLVTELIVLVVLSKLVGTCCVEISRCLHNAGVILLLVWWVACISVLLTFCILLILLLRLHSFFLDPFNNLFCLNLGRRFQDLLILVKWIVLFLLGYHCRCTILIQSWSLLISNGHFLEFFFLICWSCYCFCCRGSLLFRLLLSCCLLLLVAFVSLFIVTFVHSSVGIWLFVCLKRKVQINI